MRAAVYRGINDIRIETLPVPRIGPEEILVKVAVCGVCPTDIKKIQYGTVSPPRVFGHETAGTIVKIGKKVAGLGYKFRVGDRVALHHHIPCLECHYCRHRTYAQCTTYKKTGITAGFEPAGGGYAEYVRVMKIVLPGVVKIPSRNTFEEGAMLEPVNTVLKAVRRLELLPGDWCWVAGQGPIGLMFTKVLQINGVKVWATDLMHNRLELAKRFGAMKSCTAQALAEFIGGRQFDSAVIAVPSDQAVNQAFKFVRGGGKIMLFAHTKRLAPQGKTNNPDALIDFATICVDEKDLIGSYSADFTLQPEVSRLVFSRKLDTRQIITHRFGLEATADAIQLASKPTPESLKIIVQVEN